ncbi:MAG: hypothetical protein CSA07_02020 [Bacteroidia bacterium]|nr:MAG: hypothetical protein CSA07_02020 [Bacteroidia bacterium]
MEKKSKQYWLIGLFTVVILAFFGVFFNYLKGRNVFKSVVHYYVYFDGVEGLYKSNKVLINGMRVGDVSDISFAPDHSGRLLVELRLPPTVDLPLGTRASIVNTGMLGGRMVKLSDAYGPGPYLRDGDTIAGFTEQSIAQVMDTQMTPIMQNVDTLIVNLKHLTGWVNATMTDEARGQVLGILADAAGSTQKLNRAMDQLPALLREVNATVKEGQLAMSKAGSIADSINAMNLVAMSRRFDSVMGNLARLTAQLADSTSSLGRLTTQDRLYQDVDRAVRSLDSLVVDLKRNPGRYVKLSLW